MGKIIASGHGRESGDFGKTMAVVVIFIVALYFVIFILLGAASDYHRAPGVLGILGGDMGLYGIRFGDRVVHPNGFRVLFAGGLLMFGVYTYSSFKKMADSRIEVCENGVRGISVSKEVFELKYSQISSVHSKEDDRGTRLPSGFAEWLAKSVIVNASGKTFEVNTVSCAAIVAAINSRKNL